MDSRKTIDRSGIYKCGEICEKIGFIFREQTICDYGIDAIIERNDERYASGKLIAVQIKSGDSYFKEIKEDKVVFRGEKKHYDYWLKHSLPVIIVLYSPSNDKCIWEVFNEKNAEKTEKGWKINIPYNQKLEDSMKQLRELADNQSEYERRWNSLVVAKEWMLETVRHGESILEVQEWINKSSGRGKFILKIEKDGIEQNLFEREMLGFGTREYGQVIQDLFPWAEVKIDEEFYEENMEEYGYHRSEFTERDLATIIGKSGDELLKYSDVLPKIYPYTNIAGEIDLYRLKLTLNQIGKSFIELEHFLETGRCYFIDKILCE